MERLVSAGGDLDSFCAAPPYFISSYKDQYTFGLGQHARAAMEQCKGQRGTPALAHPDRPVGEAWFDTRYRGLLLIY